MPATLKHIQTNFDRLAALSDEQDDVKKLKEMAEQVVAKAEGNLQRAWAVLIETANEKKIAHLIPGTVGRTFAQQYGITKPRGQRERKVIATYKLSDAQAKLMAGLAGTFDEGKSPFEVDGSALNVFNGDRTAKALNRALANTEKMEDKKAAASTRSSIEAVQRKLSATNEVSA